MELSEGGKWDNCNSIINKIYFKSIKTSTNVIIIGILSPNVTVVSVKLFFHKTFL